MSLITLLTDFGSRDGYAGAMKGELLSRLPGVTLVDLSHEIEPGAIAAAAYVLRQAAPYYPVDTVHLVVVDPGVGTARRGVALRSRGQLYVAPDNGVVSLAAPAHACDAVHEIASPDLWRDAPSDVFWGRDVFAPVAAHLARGGALADVGPRVHPTSLVELAWPQPATSSSGEAVGEVVYVDRFGNLVTNLVTAGIEPAGVVEAGGVEIAVRRTYGDVAPRALVAVAGSSGLLEIACNGASAAERLGAGPGLAVRWKRDS